MDINTLNYLGLFIGIIGIVLVIFVSVTAYKRIKKADSDGKYKKYIQPFLSNSDISISEAVKYLKIVNSAEDVKKHNE